MPKLIRLYVENVLIGFALSALFVGAILWLNVAGLGHLIMTSPQGWLAALMLFIFNGLVFASVQFGIKIMMMDESYDAGAKPPRVRHHATREAQPIAIEVERSTRRR